LISQEPYYSSVKEYHGTHPVIHFSFGKINPQSLDHNLLQMKNLIKDIYHEHQYLLNSDKINNSEKNGKSLDPNPTLKMSEWQLFCSRFVRNKGRYKDYQTAKDYTMNNMCIKNILKKLSEIGKLKCFVLTPEQISIFNSLGNPPVQKLDNPREDIWEDLFVYKELQKKNINNTSVNNLIQNIQSKQNITDIEKNILNI